MIDTDKYEGHTPAPWNVKHGDMERYGETDTVVAKDDYHEYQVAEGVMRQDAQLIADAPLFLQEIKRLREDNHVLRMIDWEYERVWEWLMENADHTCRKLLLLIEEWKEEDGLVTIGGRTYEKEMIG